MADPHDRSDRFELLAVCDDATLVQLANDVLGGEPSLTIRQEPTPQLVMQQVSDPVEGRPFNLGEVVVTPAEVELDGERGFAIMAGKAERAALSGAIVDGAVASGHERAPSIVSTLAEAGAAHRERRRRDWAESQHTLVSFETMEGDE